MAMKQCEVVHIAAGSRNVLGGFVWPVCFSCLFFFFSTLSQHPTVDMVIRGRRRHLERRLILACIPVGI